MEPTENNEFETWLPNNYLLSNEFERFKSWMISQEIEIRDDCVASGTYRQVTFRKLHNGKSS